MSIIVKVSIVRVSIVKVSIINNLRRDQGQRVLA